MGRSESKEVMQNYIKVIFSLTFEMNRHFAKTSDIAKILGVAPSSVTEMIRKLSQNGLLDYTPRRGVKLNKNSIELALRLIRRYRLAELLLHKILGLDLIEATDIACKLEHIITDNMEKSIVNLLNEPKRCPHGNIIPYSLSDMRGDENCILLSEVNETGRYKVIKVFDINPPLLKVTTRLHLLPSSEIDILEVLPEKNLLVSINGEEHVLSSQISAIVVVSKI
ncbi:MAG: metal-dependent transcriptional regulator [Candidatus Asgardarchaeia archaeon]